MAQKTRLQRAGLALAVPLCATAVLVAGVSAFAQSPLPARPDQLIVGVRHVVPPFVGGSKVRTPEAPDTTLAEDVAHRMHRSLATVPAGDGATAAALQLHRPEVVLAALTDPATAASGDTVIQTGYSAAPMAIMRGDTDIRTWEQLKGRTVCVAEGSRHAGMAASRYGAIEEVFRAPADSLLALRTGRCDAAIHDDVLLDELLKFPEWKKYSAQLRGGPRTSLAFLAPAAETGLVSSLRQIVRQWKSEHTLSTLAKVRARDIAFEVYLDQNVPDCH